MAAPSASLGGSDVVIACYLVVLLLAAVQGVALGEPAAIVRGAAPYLAAMVVYLGVRAWRSRGGGDDTLLAGLAVTGAVLAVWLVVAFVVALPTGVGDPSGFYRVKLAVTSPVGDHNTAAGLLLPPIAAAAALSVRHRRWLLALGVCGLGLVASLSRGAALVLLLVACVAAGWPVVAPASRKVPAAARLIAVAAASFLIVVVLAGWFGAAPPGPVTTGVTPHAEGPLGPSIVGRADLIVRGAEVGLERPLLGIGLGRFAEHAQDLPPPNDHGHNVLAHALAEGGAPLLLVAATLPVVLAIRLRRLPRGPMRDALLLGGVAIVLHAQHDILGGRLGYEVVLAILLAVSTTHGHLVSSHGHEPSGE